MYIDRDGRFMRNLKRKRTQKFYIYEETEPYTNLTSTLELPENEQTRYIHPHIE